MRNTASMARTQQGAATIFITIVLLLAVALIALYTNRGAIMEQRLSANEIRAKQAFAAANAGLEQALAFWRNGGNPLAPVTVTPPVDVTLNNPGPPVGPLSYFRARYCSSAVVPPACPPRHTDAMPCTAPPSLTEIVVLSCGWSDDDTSVQRVTQIIGPSESLGGNVTVPLVARGTADLLNGGATVMNYFNDLTVWTGQSLVGMSMTAKTMVRNIVTNPTASENDPFRVTVSPGCNLAGYVCSSKGATMGHDTVTGDTNLSLLSQPDFFKYMFGKPVDVYRDTTATWIVDPAGTLTNRDSTSIDSIRGMTDQVIWIEGNVNGTLPSGASEVIGAPRMPGPPVIPAKPVIIIINGNLDLSSFNGTINGLVYVHGNVTGGGNPTIYGALVVAGNATPTGNINVIYDPILLGAAGKIGKAAKLPGTWRDW